MCLVLPLSAVGFLVGLLIVERTSLDYSSAFQHTPADGGAVNTHDHVGAAYAPASMQPTISVSVDEDSSNFGHEPQQATASFPASETAGAEVPAPEFSGQEREYMKLTARGLACACTMDLRVALQHAQASARHHSMKSLVDEMSRPLAALRTFGSMLAPRLKIGEPERDLAEALQVQGNQLNEVLAQLQNAIQPTRMYSFPALPSRKEQRLQQRYASLANAMQTLKDPADVSQSTRLLANEVIKGAQEQPLLPDVPHHE
jgi:gas vesicle protein